VGSALNQARRTADREGLAVRFVRGDGTRLTELDFGGRFDLLMDDGCLHMIPRSRRSSYVDRVTTVAASAALLVIVGFSRHGPIGLTRDEIKRLFADWTLLAADPVPGQQMCQYVSGPVLMRAATRPVPPVALPAALRGDQATGMISGPPTERRRAVPSSAAYSGATARFAPVRDPRHRGTAPRQLAPPESPRTLTARQPTDTMLMHTRKCSNRRGSYSWTGLSRALPTLVNRLSIPSSSQSEIHAAD
ncbi:MAG: hypothetical protein ACRDQZ_16545, partial [Mycobacteriales bacterium]